VAVNNDQEFRDIGVREELLPILQKLNILSVAQLKETKASKLLNDIGGMRKKMKLDAVAAVTLPEIEGWQK
jgi:lysyl-tRNA synthetase class 2